jgi:hypothetical protein
MFFTGSESSIAICCIYFKSIVIFVLTIVGDANVGGVKKEKNIFYKQWAFKKAALINRLVYMKEHQPKKLFNQYTMVASPATG